MITEEELQKLFNAIDLDRDGKIDIQEMALNLPFLQTIAMSENSTLSADFLADHDLDKDGKISFEEVKKRVEKAGQLQPNN